MNDVLDTLTSFRPAVAGPTDVALSRERTAFMETLAEAPTVVPRRLPRPRPRRILLGIAVALVAVVGTAAAAGVVPNDVQQALGLAARHSPDAALTPEVDQAVERTSAPTADGGTLELWTAPTTGGGTCAYLRRLDASGAPADPGPISCAVSIADDGRMSEMTMTGQAQSSSAGRTITLGALFGDGRLSAQLQVAASGAATLFGQSPSEVANVEVVDSSGAVLGQARADSGWFLLTLPADAASAAASLVAQSASGATLATMPIATPAPPANSGLEQRRLIVGWGGGRTFGRPAPSALEQRVDARRGEERQSEVGDALEERLELGLVAHGAREGRPPVVPRQAHSGERLRCALAKLPLDDESILALLHGRSIRRRVRRREPPRAFHIGDSVLASRSAASARATASMRELTPSLR